MNDSRVDQVSTYIADLELENEVLKARIDELVSFVPNETENAKHRHLLALLRDYLNHRGGVTFMDLHKFVKGNF